MYWRFDIRSADAAALLHAPLFYESLDVLVISLEFDSNIGHANSPSQDTELMIVSRFPSGNLTLQLIHIGKLFLEQPQVLRLPSSQEIIDVCDKPEILVSMDVDPRGDFAFLEPQQSHVIIDHSLSC